MSTPIPPFRFFLARRSCSRFRPAGDTLSGSLTFQRATQVYFLVKSAHGRTG